MPGPLIKDRQRYACVCACVCVQYSLINKTQATKSSLSESGLKDRVYVCVRSIRSVYMCVCVCVCACVRPAVCTCAHSEIQLPGKKAKKIERFGQRERS